MATNCGRLSTCCEDESPTDLSAVMELWKKYLQLYCMNWKRSSYNVCFTSSDGHCTHKHSQYSTCDAFLPHDAAMSRMSRNSVCLSVRHMHALWLIQRTYRQYFYTTWKRNPLMPKILAKFQWGHPRRGRHSILLVQITCLAIFLHNLSSRLLWSTSWSGALHLILHTFLHPISVFFSQHMPIPSQPVLL